MLCDSAEPTGVVPVGLAMDTTQPDHCSLNAQGVYSIPNNTGPFYSVDCSNMNVSYGNLVLPTQGFMPDMGLGVYNYSYLPPLYAYQNYGCMCCCPTFPLQSAGALTSTNNHSTSGICNSYSENLTKTAAPMHMDKVTGLESSIKPQPPSPFITTNTAVSYKGKRFSYKSPSKENNRSYNTAKRDNNNNNNNNNSNNSNGYYKNILFKTVQCNDYVNGQCPRGVKCQFAHGDGEIHDPRRHPLYKTAYCNDYQRSGTCPRQGNCFHIHDEIEKRQRPGHTTKNRKLRRSVTKEITPIALLKHPVTSAELSASYIAAAATPSSVDSPFGSHTNGLSLMNSQENDIKMHYEIMSLLPSSRLEK